jgi:hypothetical protein
VDEKVQKGMMDETMIEKRFLCYIYTSACRAARKEVEVGITVYYYYGY